MHIIGLMSGTSADGIDAVLVDTDGESNCQQIGGASVAYSPAVRAAIILARDDPAQFLADPNRRAGLIAGITNDHITAIQSVRDQFPGAVDLIGFHGQTVYHNPAAQRSIQLGDGHQIARETGIPTIYDFRQADLMAGGQGAPLVPVYHRFLATQAGLAPPVAFVNIGGVANLSVIPGPGIDDLIGYDVGPGNGAMDAYMQQHFDQPYDAGGEIAASGTANQPIIDRFLTHPFFHQDGPKSLDWAEFSHTMSDPALARLPTADAMATLASMTAQAIIMAIADLPALPTHIVVCGGGRHNRAVTDNIAAALPPSVTLIGAGPDTPTLFDGDLMEAELIAFLAARHHRQLPATFPGTTGVAVPTIAGIRANPR